MESAPRRLEFEFASYRQLLAELSRIHDVLAAANMTLRKLRERHGVENEC